MTIADALNDLIRERGYTRYLEIGCFHDTTFGAIRLDDKIGVDPVSGGNFRGTSDQFFDQNDLVFDLIFIDGDHSLEQVVKDLRISLAWLNRGGVVCLHDALPECEAQQESGDAQGAYCGQVWKAVAALADVAEVTYVTLSDVPYGLAIVRRVSDKALPSVEDWTTKAATLTWVDYQARGDELLHVHALSDLEAAEARA